MSKKVISLLLLLVVFVGTLAASITLRYQNDDSQTYKFKVKVGGSTSEVEFGASRTASITIYQGSYEEAIITCKCGDVKVKQGDHIRIKDGCIKVE